MLVSSDNIIEQYKNEQIVFDISLKIIEINYEQNLEILKTCIDYYLESSSFFSSDIYLYINIILLSCFHDGKTFYTTQFSELFDGNYSNQKLMDVFNIIQPVIYKNFKK